VNPEASLRTPTPAASPTRQQQPSTSADLDPLAQVTRNCAYGGPEKPAVVNQPAIITNSAAPGSAITATTNTIAATASNTQPADTTP
jgi:hypothetical protein